MVSTKNQSQVARKISSFSIILVTFFNAIVCSAEPASIYKLQDTVHYRKSGSSEFKPMADIELKMGKGWAVKLFKPGARVSILCPPPPPPSQASQIRERYNAGSSDLIIEISTACPSVTPLLGEDEKLKGGFEQGIPYVISPRYTLVSEDRPILRWNHVKDVTAYKVTLYQEGEPLPIGSREIERISSPASNLGFDVTTVLGIEVATSKYPFDEQLKNGDVYRLEIVAIRKGNAVLQPEISSKERIDQSKYSSSFGISGLRFMHGNLKETIKKEIGKVQEDSTIDPITKQLMIAQLYKNQNFSAKAIQTLEDIVENSKARHPDVYYKLGTFYAQSGLISLAKSAYEKALVGSKRELAQRDLLELCTLMGEDKNAILCKQIMQDI
jgi:hypothetical protein